MQREPTGWPRPWLRQSALPSIRRLFDEQFQKNLGHQRAALSE